MEEKAPYEAPTMYVKLLSKAIVTTVSETAFTCNIELPDDCFRDTDTE